MKQAAKKRLKQIALSIMTKAARFVRDDLLVGAERVSNVVLLLLICYLLFLAASLVRFILP